MTHATRQITRREPTAAVHPLDRFVQGLFRDPFFAPGFPGGLSINGAALDEAALAVDIAEDDANLVLRASVPGFKREDIAIDIHDGVVTISATLNEEKEEKQERFYRRERRTGSVSRRIALPVPVNEEAAEATLTDGVLELRLPKDGTAGPRRIAIN